MAKLDESRATVCVVASHPLLLPSIRPLLPADRWETIECSLPPVSEEPRELEIPAAAVYIFDLHPQLESTESAIQRVSVRASGMRFLVMGASFEESNAFPLLRLKARGLVTYGEAADQLARAVEAISHGGFWIPRVLLSRFVESLVAKDGSLSGLAGAADLTHREREVLAALRENLSNKQIAKKLGITERGVKFHVSNLLAKHHVRRRADLILLSLTSR